MSESSLAQLLTGSGPILLDFDGSVCAIFAGYAADAVASELRSILQQADGQLPAAVAEETDPLQILRWTATLGNAPLTRAIEDSLRAAELKAVASASPTPYAYEVLMAAQQRGRPVAIVSNNSAPAIKTYLTTHGLTNYVSYVAGRQPYYPEKMKPHPYLILESLNALNARPEDAVFIGDSLVDITASRKAGIRIVSYANKPGKLESFSTAATDAVVNTMAEVASA